MANASSQLPIPKADINPMQHRAALCLFFLCALISQIFWVPATVHAQDIGPTGRSANVEVTLKSARAAVKPGEVFHVALVQKIAPDWHTYWRNPGDSGEPTAIDWTLTDGVTASPIKWPAPKAIPFGPLVNYGFSKEVSLPVAITVPVSAKIGDTLTLTADARWLECADICIPGGAKVAVDIAVGANSSPSGDALEIETSLANLPTQFPGTTRLTDLGVDGFQLVVKGIDTPKAAYFFPYEIKSGALIDFAQPQTLVRGKDGFGLSLVKSPSTPTDLASPVGGVLVVGEGANAKSYEIAAEFEKATGGNPEPASTIAPASPLPKADIGLGLALGLALLGGLILNLMPCVFPILSMKALGLIEAGQSDLATARRHGLTYGIGVVVSFLGLAGVLIGLKAAGIAAGWGFQLQNPAIVLTLVLLMVWIGFNFLGFFEFGASLQNLGTEQVAKGGLAGSFLTGVLAVVVAAPCTAPFMGSAIGFAATQDAWAALLVFAALGIGFALPFVALTFVPVLMRAFPRPGAWMVRLREALAFPMFATAIWLIWVLSAQIGQTGVLAALVAILGAALAVWIGRTWPRGFARVLAILIALGSFGWAIQHVLRAAPVQVASTGQEADVWSQERVATLQSEGKTVFVNFTADWCVTCKVNEVSVFSDATVKQALNGEKATYLVADWTRRDDDIAEELARHGRAGVPLYLVYKPGVLEPKILPQILTAGIVLDAIQ